MEEGKYFMLLEAALSNLIKIGTLTVVFPNGSQRDLGTADSRERP
jgi:hypothetical protein